VGACRVFFLESAIQKFQVPEIELLNLISRYFEVPPFEVAEMFGDMNDLSVSISILEYIESVWDIASFIVFLLPGCNVTVMPQILGALG